MSSVEYDCDAWNRYPRHRWLFNKLELSLKLGYQAGPGGTSVPSHKNYIVRPIYNLSGMGVGARKIKIGPGDHHSVKPGEFWCEYFDGPNVSVDYEWDMVDGERVLRPVFAAQGFRTSPELYRFNAWKRIQPPHWKLPDWISDLQDVPRFNIEFIHDNIIEIHLRPGVDFPEDSTQLIPIWLDMSDDECKFFERKGFKLHLDQDDADGHLPMMRLGFFYR